MAFELVLFSSDPSVSGVAHDDKGNTFTSHPASFQNRAGIGFTFPPDHPNGNGLEIVLSWPGKPQSFVKGILWLRTGPYYPWIGDQTAALAPDDFRPPVCPACPACPPSGDHQDPTRSPLDIILAVERTGKFDLTTKEGCGLFTEECARQLHNLHSAEWGHVRKSGQQNQYNGHAVDAIMLRTATPNTPAAIYDIIVNSEAPGAKAALNFSSPVNPGLWYYPA